MILPGVTGSKNGPKKAYLVNRQYAIEVLNKHFSQILKDGSLKTPISQFFWAKKYFCAKKCQKNCATLGALLNKLFGTIFDPVAPGNCMRWFATDL